MPRSLKKPFSIAISTKDVTPVLGWMVKRTGIGAPCASTSAAAVMISPNAARPAKAVSMMRSPVVLAIVYSRLRKRDVISEAFLDVANIEDGLDGARAPRRADE